MYWRLHTAIFNERIHEAEKILQEYGDLVQIVKGKPSQLASPLEHENGPSMAITTLQDANRLLRSDNPHNPILYYSASHYNVSYWLSRMDSNISVLNRKSIFLPYSLLLNSSEEVICSVANQEKEVFIKPDAGNKTFTGFTVKYDDQFKANIENQLMFSQPELETLCVVSAKENLTSLEWRVWIGERKIIASSPYSWEEDPIFINLPQEVLKEAEKMTQNSWQPDYAYVADFGINLQGQVKLIEINAISTSGIYQANLHDLLFGFRNTILRDYDGLIDD